MEIIIREINESLLKILSDLESRRHDSQKDLDVVNGKINEKIDEAKEYKVEVDSAKVKIRNLEDEIKSLEKDLIDLNERFGNKDLTAMLEAGHKEINTKILEKQTHITKYRQKIGELTERARSIKDLLVNLKKDKNIKEDKLNILSKTYDYYSDSLNKIIEYAKSNPDSLNSYDINYNLNYDYDEEPLTEIFDEIESMDKDEPVEINESVEDKEESVIEKEISIDEELLDITEESDVELDNIFDKLQGTSLDFKELNKIVDEEYENIFGDELNTFDNTEIEEESEVEDEEDTEESLTLEPNPIPEITKNIFDTDIIFEPENMKVPDIFGNDITNAKEENHSELDSFLKKYDLDIDKFTDDDSEVLKNVFSSEHFDKMISILKDNNINLNSVYNSVDLLTKGNPEDLDQLLTKLLVANFSKANIELILNTLAYITPEDLTEIISEYGPSIKETNITEVIMKTNKKGDKPFTNDFPSYLTGLGLNNDEITIMESKINRDLWNIISNFPNIVSINYNLLKDYGINNIKEVFTNHSEMFVMNPDKFKAIFAKYDQEDLVRCIEKNAEVILKL